MLPNHGFEDRQVLLILQKAKIMALRLAPRAVCKTENGSLTNVSCACRVHSVKPFERSSCAREILRLSYKPGCPKYTDFATLIDSLL